MNFVIATGGSGGHLVPAVKVARELKSRGHTVRFIGSFRGNTGALEAEGFACEDVAAEGVPFAVNRWLLRSSAFMLRAVRRAYGALRKNRPDGVIGFGGYGAFPVVLSAVFLKIPAMVHEQNVIPGRANALLARMVNKVAVSFETSRRHFDPKKTVWTGCPCHWPQSGIDKETALRDLHLQPGKPTILVFGGSQGSARINEAFLKAAARIKEMKDFQVIHISGARDYEKVKQWYNENGISFALFRFLDKMEEAYKSADLVIARAGALTVSEIAAFETPAVLIPYPLAGGHQKENARLLCDLGQARMIEDADLTPERLAEAALEMLKGSALPRDKDVRPRQLCVPDAAQRLAAEAVGLS